MGTFIPGYAPPTVIPSPTPTPTPSTVPAPVPGISEATFNAFKQEMEDRFTTALATVNKLIDKQIEEIKRTLVPTPPTTPNPNPALVARIAELEKENAKLNTEKIVPVRRYCDIRRRLIETAQEAGVELVYDQKDAEEAYERFKGKKEWEPLIINMIHNFAKAIEKQKGHITAPIPASPATPKELSDEDIREIVASTAKTEGFRVHDDFIEFLKRTNDLSTSDAKTVLTNSITKLIEEITVQVRKIATSKSIAPTDEAISAAVTRYMIRMRDNDGNMFPLEDMIATDITEKRFE